MEVPKEVLQVLKCSRCECLLSCSPVYLCSGGNGICNACFSNEPYLPVIRSTHYEAVAKLLLFPCKYQDEGCKVNILFDKIAVHEEECPHRQIACPLQGSPFCEWFGKLAHILDHCKEKHTDKVLHSPVLHTHDITKSISHTYLLQAFDLFFLLFTKVCVTSGKIYYTVQYIGSSSKVKNFKYNLTITREDETVIKNGQVHPQECLAFQEDLSLILNINNLLGILGGFDGTSFTLTIQYTSLGEKCSRCNRLLKVKEYRDCNGWKCEYCSPDKIICKQKECSYKTFPEKLKKHYLFCRYYLYCRICEKNVTAEPVGHYDKWHHTYKYSNGSKRRIIDKTNDIFLILLNPGTALCIYSWTNSNFTLCICRGHIVK